MRYRINSKIIIHTENAAKPDTQKSAYLVDYITRLSSVGSSFDFGCGKLRYVSEILETTDTLAIIDSEIQLSRKQVIRGKLSTIRTAIKNSNRVSPYNVKDFLSCRDLYERAFCINVLSAIPHYSIRLGIAHLIRSKLVAGGTCLFVVQYRNSDFTRMKKLPNAIPWRDGFIIDSLRGYSFYAMINPERFKKLVSRAGFEILDCKLNEGSVYLYCRSTEQPSRKKFRISEENNFKILF